MWTCLIWNHTKTLNFIPRTGDERFHNVATLKDVPKACSQLNRAAITSRPLRHDTRPPDQPDSDLISCRPHEKPSLQELEIGCSNNFAMLQRFACWVLLLKAAGVQQSLLRRDAPSLACGPDTRWPDMSRGALANTLRLIWFCEMQTWIRHKAVFKEISEHKVFISETCHPQLESNLDLRTSQTVTWYVSRCPVANTLLNCSPFFET